MDKRIAIIGAGIAGLAAASVLREQGLVCTIFDKSRGVGGRMATRRVDNLSFDHGAQYFTAKGPRFRQLVAGWRAAGHIANWFDEAFVGVPGMTAPVRAMVQGFETVLDCEVKVLQRNVSGWSLVGGINNTSYSQFDAVIVSIPAPQAKALLAKADIAFPQLEQAHYAPCLALMLAFESAPDFIDHYKRFDTGPIAWIARNSSKPDRGSNSHTFVVHAGPEWSRTHIDDKPDMILDQLLPYALDAIQPKSNPIFATAHRWRYALVEQTAGISCLWNAQARIGACGDYCLGPRIEAAFESGEAMAKTLLVSLADGSQNHV